MTVTLPDVRLIDAALLARLDAVPLLKVYDGFVPQGDPPDTIPGSGGVVKPYAVLYSGGGTADSDRACQTPSILDMGPQVTVVAGAMADMLAAIVRIRAELTGSKLTLTDGTTGILREPPGRRPIMPDETVSPVRFVYPLLYQFIASV